MSTGELLREAADRADARAELLRGYLDAGSLVPDSIVDGLVVAALDAPGSGCVLDGYPRTVHQLALLDRRVALDLVIELRLSAADACERLARRRVCDHCGRTLAAPTADVAIHCDACGERMRRRSDDAPAAVRTRLATYDSVTVPMLDVCASRGNVVVVDASRSREEVSADVLRAVEGVRRSEPLRRSPADA